MSTYKYLCSNAAQHIPTGHMDRHVLESEGADNYLMNFYITNYSSTYRNPKQRPKANILSDKSLTPESLLTDKIKLERSKTGYTSNERYYLPYTRTLDDLDNPVLGRICEDNYLTTTQTHFQPYELNSGFEDLPPKTIKQISGFYREKAVHNPDSKVPLIPGKEATTYGSQFVKPAVSEPVILGQVGPKELSGFVNNTEKEPITGTGGERWLYKSRALGPSEYKEKFPPYDYSKGDDDLLNIITPITKVTSDRVIKNSVLPNDDIFPREKTEYNKSYQGTQFLPEKMGNIEIGKKVSTGPTTNEKGHVQTFDDPRRFITTYQINHHSMIPQGRDREGYTVGGVQKPVNSGYVTDVKVWKPFECFKDEREERFRLDPYQVRSLRARDLFFDDSTHDKKNRLQKPLETF
ncbi:unnamed protein product [Didymodactylos carnosus]|uniref:Protein phosphatase 1 regulatory subunit 32 n=1 Tax=Didymodactylos carnosus TaxID=1234261 RepID=A0A814PE82_9BILA|nr:unnamed protein product [Didymodactylos carnosus]CAF1104988.1 unnamed protein product [Didymodactylos carnosus]CAF3835648.1 unnamed protein product [Didymodactylos carnosus]CAF3869627.1 unnamed protein product [Didymodactylos carnosus]